MSGIKSHTCHVLDFLKVENVVDKIKEEAKNANESKLVKEIMTYRVIIFYV